MSSLHCPRPYTLAPLEGQVWVAMPRWLLVSIGSIVTVLILGVGSLRFISRMFPKTRSSQKRHLSAIL